jgi:hypothetical protein
MAKSGLPSVSFLVELISIILYMYEYGTLKPAPHFLKGIGRGRLVEGMN